MSFSKIYEEWENRQKAEGKDQNHVHNAMNEWLEKNTVPVKDDYNNNPALENWKHLAVQASLDLHGKTLREALSCVDEFIHNAKQKGLVKVRIIHGKGHHSKGKAVLKHEIRKSLEQHQFVGKIVVPKRDLGGSGALIALIR